MVEAKPRDASGMRRSWGWRVQRRRRADLGRWPFRVGICTVLALVVGVSALVERDAFSPVDRGMIALVALAVLPWLVDLLVLEVPPAVFAPVVIVPVAALHDATTFDPVPLILAVLVLDIGLWLGVRRSMPVVLASAAVVVWPVPAETDDPGWLARPLTAVVLAWLVGVVLHSQLRRIARLRSDLEDASARIRSLAAALAAARGALEDGDLPRAKGHLAAQDLDDATAPPGGVPGSS